MSGRFLFQRAVHSAVVLFGALTLVFFIVRLVPADPVRIMAGPDASPQEIQATREALGFNKPIYVQYAIYLKNVSQADLGGSLRYHRPTASLVMERFPATLQLDRKSTRLNSSH